jgi:hypothetical protein
MDPLEQCMEALRVVMDAEDDGKVLISEKIIDTYMGEFHVHEAQLRALDVLEQQVLPKLRKPSTSAVLSQIDHRRRRIAAAQEEPLQ